MRGFFFFFSFFFDTRPCLVLLFYLFGISVVAIGVNPPPPAIDSNAEMGDVPKVPAGMPVFPQQEMLNLSPEQLIRASLPWQGMDTPWRQPGGPGAVGNAWRLSKFARMNYARREPWDTDTDVDQNSPFDNSVGAPVPAHPPPYYIGDGDHESNKKMNDPTWERVVIAPPLLPNGPAQYGHGYKPPGYYQHPFKRLGTSNNAPVQVFLETNERTEGRRALRGRKEREISTTTEDVPSVSLLEVRIGSSSSPTVDGTVGASPQDVVGLPPKQFLANSNMVTNLAFPQSPQRAPLDSLPFMTQDTNLMRAAVPETGTDMLMRPTALSYRTYGKNGANDQERAEKMIFQHLEQTPTDAGPANYALYPPRPPQPLFGGA